MKATRIFSIALGILFAICALEAAFNCYILLSNSGLQAPGLGKQVFRLLLYTFVAYDFIFNSPIEPIVNWIKNKLSRVK